MAAIRRVNLALALAIAGFGVTALPERTVAQAAPTAQPVAAVTPIPFAAAPVMPPAPAPPPPAMEPRAGAVMPRSGLNAAAGGSATDSQGDGMMQHASGGSADSSVYERTGANVGGQWGSGINRARHHGHVRLIDSVYGFVDGGKHREPKEYGRYSYVVFLQRDERAIALTREILASTAQESTVATSPNELNLIEFPVRRSFWSSSDGTALLAGSTVAAVENSIVEKYYDEGFARDVLRAACRDEKVAAVMCSRGFSQGPYLITFAEPASHEHQAKPPYLVVDLGKIQPLGFSYFIERFKEQAITTELSDRSRIDNFKNRILALVLDMSSWLPGTLSPSELAVEAGG